MLCDTHCQFVQISARKPKGIRFKQTASALGANVAEAQQAQSKADFIHKINIALKEAYETNYWLRLLHATEYLNSKEYESIIADCSELEKLLIAITKAAKN